eukprot:434271-Prymnesium_polylepis.2
MSYEIADRRRRGMRFRRADVLIVRYAMCDLGGGGYTYSFSVKSRFLEQPTQPSASPTARTPHSTHGGFGRFRAGCLGCGRIPARRETDVVLR